MKRASIFGHTGRELIPAVLGLALFFAGVAAYGQQEVTDPEFGELLRGLLSHKVPELSVSEAAARKDALFLDARAEEEYNVSRIPGALWVGYREFELAALDSIPRDRPVIVYCSVGYRSEQITRKLLRAGYTDASNLYGGIFEWVNQGHPVGDSLGETARVHAYSRSWSKWLRRGDPIY